MMIDLHTHSRWSFDCNMDPARMVKVAKARGLDAIAVTDHGEFGGALEAAAAAGGDILVILGQEIETQGGEILGLFIREKIEADDPVEAIQAVHDQGGVAILPHPFTKNLSVDERVARALDGCEGFNARHAVIASVDGAAGEERITSFAREYDLSLTAGSDAHFYGEIGRARTIVPAATLDEARQQILRGNTVLSGRRTSVFNLLATGALRAMKGLLHPEPE